MTPLDPRLQTIKDALYEQLKESLDQFASTLKGTQKSLVEDQLSQEINRVLEVAPAASFKDGEDSEDV